MVIIDDKFFFHFILWIKYSYMLFFYVARKNLLYNLEQSSWQIWEEIYYEVRNLIVAISNYKYKVTNHSYRLYFKPIISMKLMVDSSTSFYRFTFTLYTNIFEANTLDVCLVGNMLKLFLINNFFFIF